MSGTYAGLAPSSVWIWRPSHAQPSEIFRTLVTEFETGAEQRRSKWNSSRMTLRLQYDRATLTIDEVADMWRFVRHKQGAYVPFLVPTYAEITRLTSGYLASVSSNFLAMGQTLDFTTNLSSHFPRLYIENDAGTFDFLHVASVHGPHTISVSATPVNSYQAENVVYPVIKARFADDVFGVDHLAVLLTTVGVQFTEVQS